MDEVVQVHDQFDILATSARMRDRTRVLKQGDTFAVFDAYGDILAHGLSEQGLYHRGTRHLSRLRLTLNGHRPLLLSSRVREQNDLFGADLTNADVIENGEVVLAHDLVHIFRARFLWGGVWYERVRLSNYSLTRLSLTVTFAYEADYADVFEVRGLTREARGEMLAATLDDGAVTLAYRGLDDEVRETRLTWSPAPQQLASSHASFSLHVAPHESQTIEVAIACARSESRQYDGACGAAQERLRQRAVQFCGVRTSHQQVNEWIRRSAADLHIMLTDTAYGEYPYAGIPWFSTPFGRDGIITALQLLWVNSSVARGVLTYLAATQADDYDAARDAEPGKILHETRDGEMAQLREVPFGRYYGSVDATPLFVLLAAAYYARTGDLALVRAIWPNIERALAWIDRDGDRDGDGFVEYARRTPKGLVQQGWKDSADSVFHADGTLAREPIALCEVQAYVYGAKRRAAELARVLGDASRASRLEHEAERLRERFEDAFWLDDLDTYALALDGDKQPCRVSTSNAGHCLFGGIVATERAERVADTLFSDDLFSGWGVRTLAATSARYNPMSYHNGSVWPHDNAIVAAGLSRYHDRRHALRILESLFDASLHVDLHRLPELFCGFRRRSGEGPTLYPVACAPQAWASGAVFMLLQAALGLTIDAPQKRVEFDTPKLPRFIDWLDIDGLVVAGSRIDVTLRRYDESVTVNVRQNEGGVQVVMRC